jgi:hypothetical protein
VNELLPIRINARLIHDRWSLVSGKPLHWKFTEEFGGEVSLSIRIQDLKSRTTKERAVDIPFRDLPATHRTRFGAKRLRELKRLHVLPLEGDEDQEITLLECTPADRAELGPECDLRDLRQQFFDLAENTEDLLQFLKRFGAWNYRKASGYWMGEHLDADAEDRRAYSWFIEAPDYFWSHRNYLKRRIEEASADLSTWFDGLHEFPRLEQIPTFPYHSISLSYIEEGLITSLSLQLLQEVRLALCARPDCRKPFSITRKDKIFCSEKCARCMVTRRGRAKKRIENSKG